MSRNRPSPWTAVNPDNVGSSSGDEISLRDEFDRFVFGTGGGVQHGHLMLIRHMRRDALGNPVECTCFSAGTNLEPDPDCSYCGGEGKLWDEAWYIAYSMYGGADSGLMRRITYGEPGAIKTDYKIFFFRYDVPIKYGDKIVEVSLDLEGNPLLPYVRESFYQPQTIDTHRSDHGRIEYISVYCREEDAIRLDNPQ